MSHQVSLVCDRAFTIGTIDRRIFGSFAEHLGRSIYGGIYEPGHPTADGNGFRGDVLALVKELGVTVVRYPGGNFVSNYNWEDGVGPRDERPRRRDLAWVAVDPNLMGTDEFIDWCRLAAVEPMLAVNLGTRGPKEAGEYVEYCNHPSGTALSDRRIANGHAQPHNVQLWCLGNEMDGPWQMGQATAIDYGRKAREAAKLMSCPDTFRAAGTPLQQEFIVCGSSNRWMATFGTWEREVLEQCYDQVHYVSLHQYYGDPAKDRATFLGKSHEMGLFIEEVVAVCDAVKAVKRSAKTINLSFDEWNVWYHSHGKDMQNQPWQVAPAQLEDVYDTADALLVGGMLITLLNHCDRVKIACQAQLVNVIAPIMTRTGGPAWRQTIFHPFAAAARAAKGEVLRLAGSAPRIDTPGAKGIPAVDCCVVAQEGGGVALLAFNRDLTQAADLKLELRGFPALAVQGWELLHDADLDAVNDEAHPERITLQAGSGATVSGNVLAATLPPASWSLIRLG